MSATASNLTSNLTSPNKTLVTDEVDVQGSLPSHSCIEQPDNKWKPLMLKGPKVEVEEELWTAVQQQLTQNADCVGMCTKEDHVKMAIIACLDGRDNADTRVFRDTVVTQEGITLEKITVP